MNQASEERATTSCHDDLRYSSMACTMVHNPQFDLRNGFASRPIGSNMPDEHRNEFKQRCHSPSCKHDRTRPDRDHGSGSSESVPKSSLAAAAERNANDAVARSNAAAAAQWRTATDPHLGKIYYWNTITRESRWKKPSELVTADEQEAIQKKEKDLRDFFAEMEANILKSLASNHNPSITGNDGGVKCRGTLVSSPTSTVSTESSSTSDYTENWSSGEERGNIVPPLRKKLLPKFVVEKRKLIRTISTMENALISQLGTPFAENRSNDKSSPKITEKTGENAPKAKITLTNRLLSKLRLINEKGDVECVLSESNHGSDIPTASSSNTPSSLPLSSATSSRARLAKPLLTKRNTCGTLYLGTTLSAPDKDALIKCVCGVYRAHILHSDGDAANVANLDTYCAVFNDAPTDRSAAARARATAANNTTRTKRRVDAFAVPSLEDITGFYRDIFLTSQMECDCIVISLVYVERLIKKTDGAARPNARNWRSILFASMVLASKVWDDLSMLNADFSMIGPPGTKFSLRRTNELEVAMLHCLRFRVDVPASEYAKYYFILRSMLQKSGIASDGMISLSPLDARGVKELRMAEGCGGDSRAGERNRLPVPRMSPARRKSFGDAESKGAVRRGSNLSDGQSSPKVQQKISLEHLVRM